MPPLPDASRVPPPREPTSPSPSRGAVASIALLVIVGALVSCLLGFNAWRSEQQRIHEDFRQRAEAQLHASRERLVLMEETVYGIRRAVGFQKVLEAHEFSLICQDIFLRFDNIQALQWVEVIANADRAKVEQTESNRLGRPFTINARQPDGSLTRAPEKPSYPTIRFVEPLAGNEVVLGYDLSTAPTQEFIARAGRDGVLILTPPFRLAQSISQDHSRGMIYILPVIKTESGQPKTIGFVQAVLKVEEIIGSTLLPANDDAINCYFYDLDVQSDRHQLLYAAHRGYRITDATDELPTPSEFDFSAEIQTGGRRWLFVATADKAWLHNQRTFDHYLLFTGGLLLTSLACSLLITAQRRASLVETLVAERTLALRTSEGELRAILDNSPNTIWIKDVEGRYVLVNEQFCRLYQRPSSEIIGNSDELFYASDIATTMRRSDQETISQNRHTTHDAEFVINGASHYFYLVKFPVRGPEGELLGVGGIATDITELKKLNEQRRNLDHQLAESQKLESLGVLAGGIAHDFNNLLTGMLGNATLIRLDADPASPIAESAIEIENAARQAADLCDQMLAYSGRSQFVVRPLSLTELVQETLPLVRASISKQTNLVLDLDNGLPSIKADAAQIRQIVMNLVINASEAMAHFGGTVRIRTSRENANPETLSRAISHPDLPGGVYVSFSVQDDGCGISAENLARIFEPFYSTKFTGRGLGLAAVLGIVRGHGGALFVRSKVNEGTAFKLLLPAASEPVVNRNPSQTVAISDSSLYGANILVAEDEPVVRRFVSVVLQDRGAVVTTTEDGLLAIDAFERMPEGFDLLILDLTMPGLNGRDVLARIRTVNPTLQVLIISGYAEAEVAEKCRELSPNGFLKKPFSSDELSATVTNLLAANRARRLL